MAATDHKSALAILSGAAMAIPGVMPEKAQAEAAPEKSTVSYRFSQYSEGEQENVVAGETSRYDISVSQLMVAGPVNDKNGYKVVLTHETMSGASPWAVQPDLTTGEPTLVMSGATISETRTAINAGYDFYNDDSIVSFSLNHSSEKDYSSYGAGFGRSASYNGNNTTVSMSASFSIDEVTPTDPDIYLYRVEKEDKQSANFAVGLSQVITANWVVAANLNTALFEGFLSDPYKLAWVDGTTVADSRPDARRQIGWSLLSRYYIEPLNAALHTDYRYFSSSWGTDSVTFDVNYYQNVGKWDIVPGIRYYFQTASNFFQNYYEEERDDGYYSSDYRLSHFDALSYRLSVSRDFNFGKIYSFFESYESQSGYDDRLRGESPALVSFSYFTVGFDYKW